MEKRKGRKSRLKDEVVARVLELIKGGIPPSKVAPLLDPPVSRQVWSYWLKQGRLELDDHEGEARSVYGRLIQAIDRGQAEDLKWLVEQHRASFSNPRGVDAKAIRFELERRHEEFKQALPGAGPQGTHPLYEVVDPQEAEAAVLDKLKSYLAAHLAAQQKAAEPAPEPVPGGAP